MRWLTGDYLAAAWVHEQVLGIYRDLGSRLGQANTLSDLRPCGRLQVIPGCGQVLGVYRDLGDRFGEADAFVYSGVVRWLTDDYRPQFGA